MLNRRKFKWGYLIGGKIYSTSQSPTIYDFHSKQLKSTCKNKRFIMQISIIFIKVYEKGCFIFLNSWYSCISMHNCIICNYWKCLIILYMLIRYFKLNTSSFLLIESTDYLVSILICIISMFSSLIEAKNRKPNVKDVKYFIWNNIAAFG